MHIKKLEISGFKSFVDRTVIHFDHDVIGIVGPNGCGKSNIVDALRWCMGEQSAKHLRGRSMEDVIFSGSESRSAHGMAEVVLTFDNSDSAYASTLPLEYRDYPEIAVARRLFRDGTSEYLINGTQVRLRDVTELFLGTGVGTKAYSIVEQGRIGQIVSARPQDRRMFIEEAAGVTKYRQRRKQAERKLELSRQNLLRINDIVSEIDRSRSSLRRQAAKADRFIRYRAEVEELSLHQASHRLLELTVVRRAGEAERSGLAGRSGELRQAVENRDEQMGKARADAGQVEGQMEQASEAAHRAEQTVASLQGELARGQDRLAHLRERLDGSSRIREELEGRAERLGEEERGLADRLEVLSAEAGALEASAQSQGQVLVSLQQREQEAARKAADCRRAASDLASRIATGEVRLQALEERQQSSGARVEQLERQAEELREAAASVSSQLQQVAPLRERALQAREQTAVTQRETQARLEEMEPHVAAADKDFRASRRELESRSSRLQVLRELERRLEGVKSGAKAVLSSGERAVVGLFADRLRIPAQLTDAMAGLLGERLEAVVATEPQTLLPLLARIRTEKKGRVHLVAERPAYPAGRPRPPVDQIDGALGLAVELVEYAPQDEPLVRCLLGNAVVVQEPQQAILASRSFGVAAVALDGTLADPSGAVMAGSVAAPQIDRRREISDLERDVQARQAEVDGLGLARKRLEEEAQALRESQETARRQAHEAELSYLGADKDLSRLQAEHDSTKKRLERLQAEIEGLRARAAECAAELEQGRAALEEHRSQVDGQQEQLAEAEESLEGSRRQVAEQTSVVTEEKVRLAQVAEQRESVGASLKRVRETFRSTEAESKELEQSAEDASVAFGETAAKLMHCRSAMREAAIAVEVHREELEKVRTKLEGIRTALAAGEEELRAFRSEQSEVDGRLAERDMELQKIQLEYEHLLGGVAERFRGLDLRRVVGDYHARPAPDEEHRRRIDELNKLIDRMGPVNLDAKAEFDEAERRYVELSAQQKDIDSAVADLERAIAHMDKESKRRLRDTFKAVNDLFVDTFQRMFRGGQAKLVLTDPDNILESGVDIFAQPPGKKLGTVELMSGGEKALTAASLIFAIFQHRPSPFCVLDEVDAPLDEANVGRYNEAIRAMTDKSQFIVITHIKKTMQSVDLLYGVTMGEPGVSRVVSVKVNESAKPRTQSGVPGAVEQSSQVA